MITDDPGRHDLTPIQTILTDQNLCLCLCKWNRTRQSLPRKLLGF
jgi:hypothetical protein